MEPCTISEVFYSADRKFGFEKAGNHWLLYDGEEGTFLKEFRSFAAMTDYMNKVRIEQHDRK